MSNWNGEQRRESDKAMEEFRRDIKEISSQITNMLMQHTLMIEQQKVTNDNLKRVSETLTNHSTKIDHVIYGNGKEGLITSVEKLKMHKDQVAKGFWVVFTAAIGSIVMHVANFFTHK